MKVVFKIIWSLPAAAIAAVLLRLALLSRALDATDAVNFARALDSFDLSLHQPHFPGYPLYILGSRLFASLGPERALAMPGALATALMVWAVHRALRARFGDSAATCSSWLIAVALPLVDVGSATASDGLALALAACAFAEVTRQRWLGALSPRTFALAGALLGLAFGVRPSYSPLAASFAALLLVVRASARHWLAAATGGLAAILLWMLPLILIVGPRQLIALGHEHVTGHFSIWGGAITSSPLTPAERTWLFLRHVTAGLGLSALCALAFHLSRSRRETLNKSVLWVAAPYALWVLLAQNADRARHAAPLALMLCAVIGIVVASRSRRAGPVLAIGAALAMTLVSIPSLRSERSWRHDTLAFIASRIGVERVVLAGTHLPRVASFYAPPLRTERVDGGADVARLVARLPGVTVLTTSEVPDLDRVELEPLARFGAQTLYRASLRPLEARR